MEPQYIFDTEWNLSVEQYQKLVKYRIPAQIHILVYSFFDLVFIDVNNNFDNFRQLYFVQILLRPLVLRQYATEVCLTKCLRKFDANDTQP